MKKTKEEMLNRLAFLRECGEKEAEDALANGGQERGQNNGR